MKLALIVSEAACLGMLIYWGLNFQPALQFVYPIVFNTILLLTLSITAVFLIIKKIATPSQDSEYHLLRYCQGKHVLTGCIASGHLLLLLINIVLGFYFLFGTSISPFYIHNMATIGIIAGSLLSELIEAAGHSYRGKYWIFYSICFLFQTVLSGVMVSEVKTINSFVLIQWLAGFMFLLKVMRKNAIYYVLTVVYACFLVMSINLLIVNYSKSEYLAVNLVSTGMLVSMISVFLYNAYNTVQRYRFGDQNLQGSDNQTLNRIIIERQLQTKTELVIRGIDEECMICLQSYQANSKLSRLDCKHQFHLECISSWMVQKRECPVCRTALKIEVPK